MADKNYLDEDKVLIWNTILPYKNEPRTSPVFSFMGSEWCFRFVYCDNYGDYHVINLHQTNDGKILEKFKTLEKPFSVKTYMMSITERDVEIAVQKKSVDSNGKYVWYSGAQRDKIFKTLSWLRDCPEVKFACKFYGHAPFKFQPKIETDHISVEISEKLPLRTEDKGVQVSTVVPRDIESLSSDFSHLLENEILPDVKLECGGRTFRAHKSVLAARSQVFRAMFQNGMLESETGAVKIQDMDVAVLQKLLKFLYSRKPDDLSEDCTADLYESADKCDVLSLKTACAYWIVRNLTVENCVKYLKIIDSHSDHNLKADVVSFITRNPSVMKSEAWLELSKELPVLAIEVFQTYITSTVQ